MAKIMIGTEEVSKIMMGTEEVSLLSMGGETIPVSGSPAPTPTPVYSAMPFTIEALGSGSFNINLADVSYSTDKGSTWETTTGATTINLSSGDTVQFLHSGASNSMLGNNTGITFNVYGNIMSLLYEDNYIGQTSIDANRAFFQLLKASNVVEADNLILPALSLTEYCYYGMFSGCTLFTAAPELPVATAFTGNYAYGSMFKKCTSLTKGPDLLLPTLTNKCYSSLFDGCSSLNYVRCLATSGLTYDELSYWMYDVPAGGTFVRAAGVTWPSSKNYGVPSSWTIVDDQ